MLNSKDKKKTRTETEGQLSLFSNILPNKTFGKQDVTAGFTVCTTRLGRWEIDFPHHYFGFREIVCQCDGASLPVSAFAIYPPLRLTGIVTFRKSSYNVGSEDCC